MNRFLYLVGLCVFFVGCAPKETTKAVGTNNETVTSTEEPKGNAPGATTSKTPKPVVDVSVIPAELKHDGFEFYGLGNSKPVDMEVKSEPDGRVITGSQTTTLESYENGKAVFRRQSTGGLENTLGSFEYVVEPKGIYVKSSTVAKTKGHDLEIPASLSPGTTWKDTTDIEMNGQTLKMASSYKVVGTQKVKTKKGSFDALLITSTGSGVVSGRNVRMDSKSWYVKGIGNVRTEVKIVGTDGKTSTITCQVV